MAHDTGDGRRRRTPAAREEVTHRGGGREEEEETHPWELDEGAHTVREPHMPYDRLVEKVGRGVSAVSSSSSTTPRSSTIGLQHGRRSSRAVAHVAGDELQGGVALSTPRYCNRFCFMLHNSMHVAIIIFGCSIC